MNLFVDESGNTGETLTLDSGFNFQKQPYYVLSGLFVQDNIVKSFTDFIALQRTKFRIQANELKAKSIYDTKPKFIIELIDYILENKLPFFIEVMDKQYYLSIQIIEHVMVTINDAENEQQIKNTKLGLSNILNQILDFDIYDRFIRAYINPTDESLMEFYDSLIHYFTKKELEYPCDWVRYTKQSYLDAREINAKDALEQYTVLPDRNARNKLTFFLPAYNAFTGLIARAQKFCDGNGSGIFNVIHDEQKQFDVIFQNAFDMMKGNDINKFASDKISMEYDSFNINSANNLYFEDSKSQVFLQIADLLSGFVMRFWSDFINGNTETVNSYLSTMKKITFPYNGTGIGIRFVVPDDNYSQYIQLSTTV